MNRTERINSFSYIRAISCCAIIVLHVFASAAILFGENLEAIQNIASRLIVNCMMWAVPCFVMTTGALLLDVKRELTYKKLFGRYILRIAIALVVFCLIFRIFDMVMNREKAGIGILTDGIYKIFTGTSWSHMWYLYLLIGLYLLLPFYKKIVKYSEKSEIKYLLAIYLLFLSVLPLFNLWNLNCGFYIHVSTIYPFYLFCGHAIHNEIFKCKKWISWGMTVLGTGSIVILTVIRWKYDIVSLEQMWSYSSIFVVMQGVGIFSLLELMGKNEKIKTSNVLVEIDKCSFGIYLIHMIPIRLIFRYMEINPYENHVFLNFIIAIVLVFIIAFIITWILKRIPGVRNLL